MSYRKSSLTGLIVIIFLIALIPSGFAFKGYQLSRTSVDDFTLTDQNGQDVNLTDTRGDVVVVAFIFTRCPDVCPVITQSLRGVQEQLGEDYQEHVSIIPITVDPEHDTPEKLSEFTELHGVDWPHLTGDLEEMEPVWSSFGITVQKAVIEAHVGEINGHQADDSTIILVNKSGQSTELMNLPTAFSTLKYAAHEAGWDINYSMSSYGPFIHGINGVDQIYAECNCYWAVKTFNSTSNNWEASMVGIGSVEYPLGNNIALVASNSDASLLSPPDLNNSSVVIIYPNNTTDFQQIHDNTGWHLSTGALDGAGINHCMPYSQYGHFMNSINNEHYHLNPCYHGLSVLFPDNSSVIFESKHDLFPNNASGWNLTETALTANDVTYDYQNSEYGAFLTTVAGIEAPEYGSVSNDEYWYWSIYVWNETSNAWEMSPVGLSSIQLKATPHVAIAASNADLTLIPNPEYRSQDESWWWQLHDWNDTSMRWEVSQVGMDSLISPNYLAWAPNSTLSEEIPIPGVFVENESQVCNGYGWEMGNGPNRHCMCDEGYEWPENSMLSCVVADVEEEYNVGHSTTTLILDTQLRPVVAWTGDGWKVEEFIDDLEQVVEDEGLVETETDGIPGFGVFASILAITLAAFAIGPKSRKSR